MVLVPYRSMNVFSLGGWTPHLPAGLACPAVLYAAYHRSSTGLSPSAVGLPMPFDSVFLCCGLFRFRSPLLAESFLFLGLLGCFGSSGALVPVYVFNQPCHPMPGGGFPHSDISGSGDCTRLAGAFRSVPRPSSAFIAKSFPLCPCSFSARTMSCGEPYYVFSSRYLDSSEHTRPRTAIACSLLCTSILSALRLRCAVGKVAGDCSPTDV